MRLNELFEKQLNEVNMSPGALLDFANGPFAQSMQAGFEAELIVPDVINSDDNDDDLKPDFTHDPRVTSFAEITSFFSDGDFAPGSRYIAQAVEKIERKFSEYTDEQKKLEFEDKEVLLIKDEMTDDGLSSREIDKHFKNTNSNTFKSYRTQAYNKFHDEYEISDSDISHFFRDNYPKMSNIHQSFNLDWPHMTTSSSNSASSVEDIADIISQSIGIKVKTSQSYQSTQRRSNYFILEPDSTIGANAGEAGLELISPPMPLAQTLEYLDKVLSWANDYKCRTDESTGFHMGISIPEQTLNNIDQLKFILFLGDEYVLAQFGRLKNEYTKSVWQTMLASIRNDPSKIQSILTAFKKGLDKEAAMRIRLLSSNSDRYVSVNFKSNYIEVRSAGGNYLGQLDKIKLTLMRYVRALAIAADPQAEKQEYAKKLYKMFLETVPDGLQDEKELIGYFAQYNSNNLSAEELKNYIKRVQINRSMKKTFATNNPKASNAVRYQIIRLQDRAKVHEFLARNPVHAATEKEDWAEENRVNSRDYIVTTITP